MKEYKITDMEYLAYEKFKEKHRHKKKIGIKGTSITFDLSTGIGQNVRVKCNYCGKEKDITDYSVW